MIDALGNPLTLADPSSLAGVDAFVEGFIACEARVLDVLGAVAHDDAPIESRRRAPDAAAGARRGARSRCAGASRGRTMRSRT
ncbi:MAG: hypothetical protein ACK5PW_15135 [Burkholderiales bacterium]